MADMNNLSNYIEILEASFNKAASLLGQDEFGKQFFTHFFSIYPESKAFFEGTDTDYFGWKKLNIIFEFIKDIIQHPNFAEGQISQEVIRHQMYGLQDKAYYFTLIDCLPLTIKQALKDDWSEEQESAWNDLTTAFKAIISQAADDFL